MDIELLAAELIRALRGRRSQAAFSRRLGFQTNVVHTWEARRRWPTASRTFAAAERAGIDVRAALTRFYRTAPQWLVKGPTAPDVTSPELIAQLLLDLQGRSTIADVALRAGRSRFAVARWIKGEAEPRLPDFLRMIEATSLRLLDFVAAFVDPEQLPSASASWQQLEAGRRAAFQLPWSHAVLRVLELESYRAAAVHRRGFIAAQLDISLEEEEQCVQALLTSGQLDWDGSRYRVNERLTDTSHNPEAGRILKIWWTEQALTRLKQDREGLYSYNLFAVSERDYQRLRQLHLDYFRELRSIVAQSGPAERVVLAHLQLLPLAGGPSQPGAPSAPRPEQKDRRAAPPGKPAAPKQRRKSP
jgi:DNA-binding phage protein